MENSIEIDIRKYIRSLIAHWLWIFIPAASVGILALIASSLIPASYQATALVAITRPRNQLTFDSRFITNYSILPSIAAYLDLAISDAVLDPLFDQWTNRADNVRSLSDLREKILTARSASDSMNIKLMVTSKNPEQAAWLANQWSLLFINQANIIYFNQDQQVQFLENQITIARSNLDDTEEALVAFQAQNQLNILTNKLNSILQTQYEYLTILRNLEYLRQSAVGILNQVMTDPIDPVIADVRLSALLLQLQTYNIQINSIPEFSQADISTSFSSRQSSNMNLLPMQLQINNLSAFRDLSVQELKITLNNLVTSMQDRNTHINAILVTLPSNILDLQRSVQDYAVQEGEMEMKVKVALSTYSTLVNKLDEARISTQDPTYKGIQLASSATLPSGSLPRNRLRNTLLAAGIAAVLAVIMIFTLEWWRGENNPSAN
jgi:uncharacterized protein involved in exopolysaccharide biosynthesis